MNVILEENTKSPVVSVHVWVKTGSADERSREEGISHFIEHLLFKGTRSFGVGEIASSVEGAGGEVNAYTSFDQTVFHITISKRQVDLSLKILSEMMACPRFEEEEVEKEKEVVIEEIKRSLDSPHRNASRLLFESSFKEHPYGKPVIGYQDVVKKLTSDEIKKFFSKRYVPSNMNLIVVGDFDTKEIKKKIKQFFEEIPSRNLESRAREGGPELQTVQVASKKVDFANTIIHLAWKAPDITSKDSKVLSALALILGQGGEFTFSQ